MNQCSFRHSSRSVPLKLSTLDKLHLRVGALATLALWNLQAAKVDDFITYGTKRRSGHVLLLKDSLVHAPLRPVVYFSEEFQQLVARERGEPTKIDEVTELHKQVLREGVPEQGGLLRAAELAVAEVGEAFGGGDPALPDVRRLIDRAEEQLVELRKAAEGFTGPLAVAEPDDELVDKVWRLVEDTRP